MIKKALSSITPQQIKNYLYHLPRAALATYLYGNPAKDLNIIAVTGTDGKTTTTTLIYHILKTARKKAALITTVAARIGRKSIGTGLHVTSPNPLKLQPLLKNMKNKKIKYVCLEVTSIGLDQFRLFPLKPKVAVLTNITPEHLDYHKTMDNYIRAKLRLFKKAQNAVVNKDAKVFNRIKESLPKVSFATYSVDSESQLQPSKVAFLKTKTKFTLGNVDYEFPMTGKHNLSNALAAISAALVLNIAPADIKRALATFKGIKGRLEKIPNNQHLNIIIDFAHTPNALDCTLTHLLELKDPQSKLISVLGSAGLRDANKRPLMGKIAACLSDEVVITAEDPRTERLNDIIQEIREGIPDKLNYKIHVIHNRQEAISYAINKLARKGDWVAILGKGHEKSMCFGTKEHPWSEHKAVEKALQSNSKK